MDDDLCYSEDLELLGRTLDEELLRWPLSPDKAWEYYRLAFDEEEPYAKKQTPGDSFDDNSEIFQSDNLEMKFCHFGQHNTLGQSQESSASRTSPEFTEHSSPETESSPITITAFQTALIQAENKASIGEQSPLPIGSYKPSVFEQCAEPCDINIINFVEGFLFTTEPKDLQREYVGACSPLTEKKVNLTCTAVDNNQQSSHKQLLPYTSDGDLVVTLYEDKAQYIDGTIDCSTYLLPENISDDYKMYGYNRDSGIRRYHGSSSSISSSLRSQGSSPRTQYGRPTMISSLSSGLYAPRSSDISYGSSSLRRSTSVGSSRPLYSSSSILDRPSSSHVINVSRTPTYGGMSRESYTSSGISREPYRSLPTSTMTARATAYDSNASSSRTSQPSYSEPYSKQDILGWGHGLTSSTNSTGNIVSNENDAKDSQQRLGQSTESDPVTNNSGQMEMRSTNLLEDGPVDSSKVVSQLIDINKSHKKPEQCSYNRQIWSRPDDFENKSTEISHSSNIRNNHWSRRRDCSLSEDRRADDNLAISRRADDNLVISGRADDKLVISSDTDTKIYTGINDRSDASVTKGVDYYRTETSYSYCPPSPIVTAVQSGSICDTMGSNVHSTVQSPVSQQDDTAGDVTDNSNESFEDLVRSARSRRKSQDEKSVFTEETSSFVFRDGQWVEDNSTDGSVSPTEEQTDTHSQIMRPLLFGPVQSYVNPDEDDHDETFHTPSDELETEPWEFLDLVTSTSDIQSPGEKSDTDGHRQYSKGDHPVEKSREDSKMAERRRDLSTPGAQGDNAAMELYRERMDIISKFEGTGDTGEKSYHSSKSGRGQQQVVTEIIDIPFSPPTFTVCNTPESSRRQRGRKPSQESTLGSDVVVAAASTSSDITSVPSPVTDVSGVMSAQDRGDSSVECLDRQFDRPSRVLDNTAGSPSTEHHTSQQPETLTMNRPNPVDSQIFFSRKNANLSGRPINKEGKETDITEGNSRSMGAVISTSSAGSYNTQTGDINYKEDTHNDFFQPAQAVPESRPILERPNSLELPGGPDSDVALHVLRDCFFADRNVNTTNDVNTGPSRVNRTGLNNSNTDGKQVIVQGFSDSTNSDQDTSRVGENNSPCLSEKTGSLSIAQQPEATTPLTGNNSAHESHTQIVSTGDSNRYTGDTPELEGDMSNRQVSQRQGGTYYSGNINRRNVTTVLASDSEDRRRALALSQTETQRMGEMVQTNNTPGNRSELRQTHSGQTFTKRASGAEVSNDGDRTRARDVSQTVDRSRTETERVAETPSGRSQVSKVREDRESQIHQDRQEQSEIKNGAQVKQSSSTKSESNQVNRVIESGDSRISQRQERHFKSSSVTRSSRSSDYSNDRPFLAAAEDSSLSDDDSDEPGEWLHIEEGEPQENTIDPRDNSSDTQVRRTSQREGGQRQKNGRSFRETVVHDHKAAEVQTNAVTKTNREGSIHLEEQQERAGLDRGVTRTIVNPDQGIIRTQRVQQRAQVQTASRTASSGNSRTDGSDQGDSGTVSAEDESVLLAAILGRLEEKEIPPFTPGDYQQTEVAPTAMRSQVDRGGPSGTSLALIRGNRQTDIDDDSEPSISAEEQSRAIERARQEFQARQTSLQRVPRKRTIIVDEEMMEELFLRCIICRERYNTDDQMPKLLPCHHTFCLSCLKEMFRVEAEYRQGLTSAFRDAPNFVSIQCPTCRTTHMITDREYKNFKSDHKLLELLEISSLPAKGAVGYCKTHRTQSTDQFCETCIQPVCIDCKVLDHRATDDHAVHSRSEALKLYANQARNTISDVEAEDKELAETEEKLKNAIGFINDRLSESEQSIRQTFEKFKVAINNRQDQLLEKIENEMGRRKEDFSKDLDEITKRMETIDKTQTTTKQAQDDEDVEKMFKAHQNAREMLKNTVEMSNDPNSNIKASFFYEKRDRANINNTVSDHGMMTFQS